MRQQARAPALRHALRRGEQRADHHSAMAVVSTHVRIRDDARIQRERLVF